MDDLISRQAAIERLTAEANAKGAYGYVDTKTIVDCLNSMSPAQPEQKWVWNKDSLTYKCTKCGFEYSPKGYEDGTIDFSYNYCPNCGCKMEKETENF